MTGPFRAESGEDARVAHLLRKTIENGATAAEEVAAVQLAHMIVRQHGLDLDAFTAALARIGDPPRYRITAEGFLVPADMTRNAGSEGAAPPRDAEPEQPRDQPRAGNDRSEDACPVSPTRRHRLERQMRGSFATGMLYCLHCGVTRWP